MNSGIKKILVIGGGFAGMRRVALSRQGFDVDLLRSMGLAVLRRRHQPAWLDPARYQRAGSD